MAKRIIAAGAAAILSAALGALAAGAPPGAEPVTRVVKYAGTRESTVGVRQMVLLSITSKYGGSPMDIAVPNNDPNARKADPIASAMSVLRGLQKGDFIQVRYTAAGPGRFVLEQVEKFTARPGEEDPEAYEFVRLTEANLAGQVSQVVVLRKADKEQTALVLVKKNAQGATVPDDAVLAQIGKLSRGDLADAEISQSGASTYLRGLYPYQAPKSATFVKSGTVKADGNTLSTVELKADPQTTVAHLRPTGPAGAADPVLMGKVRSLQANAPVVYKTIEDGGRTWLLSIGPNVQTGEITLNGSCEWNGRRGRRAPLKAVLKPTGNGEWSAVYSFTWDGRPKTYTGTVKGDLKNGDVSGTGNGDNRRFTFTGKSQGGVLSMDCFELTGGRTVPQGNATLR